MWTGVLIVLFSVGVGKVVTFFLSWLNEYLASFSLVMVCVIFLAVGLVKRRAAHTHTSTHTHARAQTRFFKNFV
jgi:hypothetical protein